MTATDGAGSRSEDVLVSVTQTNQDPVFSELPKLFGREGDTLFFAIGASDTDIQPLVYRLDSVGGDWTRSDLPAGLRFDSTERALEWQAGFDMAGNYVLNFHVSDPEGGFDTMAVNVQILPTNRAPQLTLPSLRNAEIGREFAILVSAEDLDGDSVTLTASDLPAGATLGSDRILRWTPQGFQAGQSTIRITATDGDLSTTRNLTLVASFEPAAPDLRLVVTPSFPAVPGQKIVIEPIADSDVAVGRATLSINGKTLALDQLGRATFVADAPGRYEVIATVTDEEGRTSTKTQAVFVRDPSDRDEPTIEVDQLTPPIITEPRVLMIEIGDATLAEYIIEMIPRGGGQPVEIGRGATSICQEVTLEPGRFINGFYTLRVTARDLGGLETVLNSDLEINSATKVGALEDAVTDLSVTLADIEVDFNRYYSSLGAGRSLDVINNTVDIQGVSFGNAWSLPMVNPQVALSAPKGDGKFGAEPLRLGDRLYLSLPTGQRVGFTFSPTMHVQDGINMYRPAWIADQGVTWRLGSFDIQLQQPGSDEAFYMVGGGLPYNLTLDKGSRLPVSTLMLTSPEGVTYGYRVAGESSLGPRFVLERITAANGEKSLRWTDSGLVAADGSRVTVVRDTEGSITELIGPSGEHRVYRYDDAGQMTIAMDGVSGARTFYDYDEAGRLIVASPSSAATRVNQYDETSGEFLRTLNAQSHRGGTRQFLNQPINDTLQESGVQRYAFTITEGELRSSSTGSITIGFEVTSSDFDPAAVQFFGTQAGYRFTAAGRSITLLTIDEPGTYAFAIARADGQAITGRFSASVYLAGDLNQDFVINAADQTFFEAALGSTTSDTNYYLFADTNRNGTIDLQDRAALLASFGYIANRAPVANAEAAIPTSRNANSIVVDAKALLHDPETEDFYAFSTSVSDVSVTLLGNGLHIAKPTGPNPILRISGDDGIIAGNDLDKAIPIELVQVKRLVVSESELVLGPGQFFAIHVLAEQSNGELIELSNDEIVFASLNSNTAVVTDSGLIIAGAFGTTAITVSALGIHTAVAISIGERDGDARQFYPETYALPIGQTRQAVIRALRDGDVGTQARVENVSAAVSGAIYVSSNPAIATVTSDGLITALAAGTVDIAMVQGGYRSVSQLKIEEQPSSGVKTVGPDGGVVLGGTIQLGIAPGALSESANVSVTVLDESNAPYNLPAGFEFVSGLNIDSGLAEVLGEVSVRMPAPVGYSAGDVVYAFRPVHILQEDGSTLASWAIVDALTVDNEGMLATNSPPWRSLGPSGGTFQVLPNLAGLMMFAAPGIATAVAVVGVINSKISSGIETIGSDGNPYIVASSPLGDFYMPTPSRADIRITIRSVNGTGNVNAIDYIVDTSEGKTVNMGLVVPPRPVPLGRPVPPLIEKVRVEIVEGQPFLVIEGKDILEPIEGSDGSDIANLVVRLTVGGQDIPDRMDGIELIGGRDVVIPGSTASVSNNQLRAPIPQGAAVGDAYITIERPGLVFNNDTGRLDNEILTSNPAQLVSVSQYLFAAQAGGTAIDVIRTDSMVETSIGDKQHPVRIGQIEVDNLDVRLGTYDITMSTDGARGYVLLPSTGRVGVLDPIALRMVDVKVGIDRDAGEIEDRVDSIKLPEGASPHRATYDFDRDRLYITDRIKPTVYVLDTNPISGTFHEVIETFSIPFRGRGLSDILLSADASRLYVGVPDPNRLEGFLYVVKLNKPGEPTQLSPSEEGFLDVGPDPYRFTRTDDPNVVIVVDRSSDSQGIALIKYVPDPKMPTHEPAAFIDLNSFTPDIDRRVIGITNPSDVVYIPADALKDPKSKIPEIANGHPAYILVSSFNRFRQGDPKHDPNLGPFQLGDGRFVGKDEMGNDQLILLPFAAGSNIGVIRDPFAALDGTKVRPATVTRPIPMGFADSLTLSADGSQVFLGLQSRSQITGYSLPQLILNTEITTEQYIDSRATGLGSLIQRLPLDAVVPTVGTNADLRFYSPFDEDGIIDPDNVYFDLVFGVPPVGPLGEKPNLFAPIEVGRLPRGLTATVARQADSLPTVAVAQNEAPSLCDLDAMRCSLTLEAGLTAEVDAHRGVLLETHVFPTYMTGDQQLGLQLRYDSARALVRPMLHVAYPTVPTGGDTVIASLKATLGESTYEGQGYQDEPAIMESLGLTGGEHFFQKPSKPNEGFALQIDLSKGDSGVYQFDVDVGLYRQSGGKFVGRDTPFKSAVAVVNSRDSSFGAGWDLAGYRRIYDTGGLLLMADGDGTESVWQLSLDAEGKPRYGSKTDLGKLELIEGRFVYTNRQGVVDRYNSDDRLESRTDRNGNVLKFVHEGERLVAVVDHIGQETRFTYSGDRVSTIQDPAGRVFSLTYSGKDLIGIRDPDATTRSFQYDPKMPSLMIGQTHKRGFRESYEYDDFGMLESGTRVDGQQFQITPSRAAGIRDIGDSTLPFAPAKVEQLSGGTGAIAGAEYVGFDRRETALEVDEYGRLSKSENSARTVKMERNTIGQVRVVDDGFGYITRFSYNQAGDLIEELHQPPNGPTWSRTFAYNTSGDLIRTVDRGNITTEIMVDGAGNPLKTTVLTADLPPLVTSYVYDRFGSVIQSTDPLGRTTTTLRDVLGRTETINLPNGDTIRFDYDEAGNVTRSSRGGVTTATATYDRMNRTLINSIGGILESTSSYDQAGNPINSTSELGGVLATTYDPLNREIRSVNPLGGVTSTSYDLRGNVIQKTTPQDGTTTYEFDELDRMISLTDALGRKQSMEYDRLGRLSSISDALGRVTTIAYDSRDNEIERVEPGGRKTIQTYDIRDNRTSIVDPMGRVTRFVPDSLGRITQLIDPAGGIESYTYDLVGNRLTQIDQLGRRTTWEYDTLDRLIEVVDPAGGTIANQYDSVGRLMHVTDQLGFIVENQYDSAGRVVKTLEPNGAISSTEYQNGGRIELITDALGNVSRIEKDVVGNTIAVINANGFTSSSQFDNAGRQVRTTDAKGATTRFVFDQVGRSVATVDAHGNTASTSFDNADRPLAITDVAGNTARLQYNALDQLVSQTDALGNVTSYRYDLAGNVLAWTDPLGRVTRTTYDVLDRPVSVVDPLGFVGSRTYDVVGQLLSERDPLGNTTSYQYDALGNLIVVTDALGNVSSSFYDAANQLIKTVDANGNQTLIGYDDAGREVFVQAADGGRNTKEYDLVGNLITATDPIGRVTRFEYDAEGQLIRRVDPAGGITSFERDARGSITETVDAEGGVTKYEYDLLGRKISDADPLGRTTTFAYDPLGNLVTVVSPSGNTTRHVYDRLSRKVEEVTAIGASFKTGFDAVGNVVTLTDPAGNTRRYSYDSNDRLISETNSVGAETKYVYDAAGRRTSTIDANNNSTKFEYDALGRVTKRIHADDSTFGFVFDAVGNQIQLINELGKVWTSEFDSVGRTVAQQDPLDNRATTVFDLAGQRIRETDGLGNTFGFVYDALGNQVEQLYPSPGDGVPDAKVTTTHDKLGRTVKLTNRLGFSETYVFNAAGQRIATTDALGLTTTFEYDRDGNLVKTLLPSGQTIGTEYDKLYRPIKTVDPAGAASSTVYSLAGNIVSTTDQLGRTTFYEYDAESRQTSVMAPDGTTVRRTYDGVGNLLTETDSQGRTVSFEYDNRNRMRSTTQSDGSKTTQNYNIASYLTSVVDPSGNTTSYEYDDVGREKTVIDALGGRTELVFDVMGRLVERTEPRGQKVQFVLDNWGRVIQEKWLNGGTPYRTIVSRYDANDNLLSINDGESSLSFKYDPRSKVTNSTQSYNGPLGIYTAAVNFNYDAVGRPNGNTILVDGKIVHDTVQTYTPAGNTDSIEFRIPGSLTAKAQYGWDAAYQLIAINRTVALDGSSPATVNTSRVTDAHGRSIFISHTIDSTNNADDRVQEQRFVYDTANRLIRSSDDFGVHNYAYDSIGQLAKVTHDNTSLPPQNYTFDAAGNPSELNGQSVSVGLGNRLVNDGNFNYSYDAAGNLVRRVSLADGSATDYVWDIRDRLVEVSQSNGGGSVIRRVRYAYDPANRRIAEMTTEEGADSSRFFIYDKEDIAVQLADVDGPVGTATPTVSKQFFHGVGSDQILASFDASALKGTEPTDDEILSALNWYLTDHLGSVRDVVDGQGRTLDTILYDAFGNMLVRSNAAVDLPYGFTGRELDVKTGLYYYRARYYDPAVGRFLTPDPSGLATGDTNLYRYVGNNPASLVDPSGLEAKAANSISSLLDSAASGVHSFRNWAGMSTRQIEKETELFLFRNDWRESKTKSFLAYAASSLIDLPRHVENLLLFGAGFAEAAEENFFEFGKIASDVNNRYHGIQTSDSNLFKAYDSASSSGTDAAFLGLSLVVAPLFSFIDFGQKVASGDPKAAGKSTFTTLPAIAGVSKFFPGRLTRVPNYTRIAQTFFGQPFSNGFKSLLQSPASLGGLVSLARQTVRRSSIAKQAIRPGNFTRNRGEFLDELKNRGQLDEFIDATQFNNNAARNSPYQGKSAEQILGSLKGGVHRSVREAIRNNTAFGQQLRYVLEKMHNSPGIYNRTIQLLSEKRSVKDFRRKALATDDDLAVIAEVSKLYPDHTVSLNGSNGSSLGSLVNQHILVEALQNGQLSLKSLRKLHPEVDIEALLTGRLLANPTKIGGQFGGSLDFDIAISNGTNFKGLKPFREQFSVAELESINAILPKGSKLDTMYGFYENESLTGFSFTNRGRVLFQNGKAIGRQDSHLYGVDGRVVRDFPDLFAEAGVGQSSALFNRKDWARVRPTLPVYATLFAYEVSAGWVGANDIIGGAAKLNSKKEEGNYVYQFRQVFGLGAPPDVTGRVALAQVATTELPFGPQVFNQALTIAPTVNPIETHGTSVTFVMNTSGRESFDGSSQSTIHNILTAAWNAWSVSTSDAGFDRIDVKFENLPGMQIAEARPATLSSTPQIIIDTDGAGLGWFIDTTPDTNEEFASDSLAATRFDLLTVLTHEIGHLLGFGAGFEMFDGRVQSEGHTPYLSNGAMRWYLNDSYTELDPTKHGYAVMAATISPGVRRYPSWEEKSLIASLAGSTFTSPSRLHQHGDGVESIGFVTLAQAQTRAIQSNGIVSGLRNSQFANGSSVWVTEGTVAFTNQSATLSEATSAVTDLSQTFRMPSNTDRLFFTIDGAGIEQNTQSGASDAFEVALLNAVRTANLVGGMQGLAGSDALLSIQADGRVFFAPEVSIAGVVSGDRIDLTQPINVTIDVSEIPAETVATLYFDLVGFGEDSSEVAISNLKLNSALSWHNSVLPEDTDGQFGVNALDVLALINEINAPRILSPNSQLLPTITDLVGPPPFYDVDDDGYLTPLDVLRVINYINFRMAGGGGEGEGRDPNSGLGIEINVINELNLLEFNDIGDVDERIIDAALLEAFPRESNEATIPILAGTADAIFNGFDEFTFSLEDLEDREKGTGSVGEGSMLSFAP